MNFLMKRTSVVALIFGLLFLFGCDIPSNTDFNLSTVKLPDPGSEGAKLLKQYCTDCHGAPMPSVHKQNEWRNVVYRMNVRRLKRALGTIPDEEVDTLVAYMEKHSR